LFVHYRYTVRIWKLLKEWIGIQGFFPKAMGGHRHQRLVVFYGGGIKPASEGFGFTHLANRLRDLERKER
jgi:hypothetical protein